MKRRTFVGKLLYMGTAVATSSLRSHGATRAPVPKHGAASTAVEEATEWSRALVSGRRTSHELAKTCLRAIRATNLHGPAVRAVLVTDPEVLAKGEALDEPRGREGSLGPLHGLPILLKDNVDTGDRLPTTAGSLALAGTRAPRDAEVTRRLRNAGALILGKTNLSEWANIRSTRSSSGWSALGGQTRNPYSLDRSPSGSSSGSAVAVAAGFCAAAVGTETDGSVVSPAAACSIVGLKPTVGLVSRRGIIPISSTQDTAGPMARTVADAALLLGAMAGEDPEDPSTLGASRHRESDYTRWLDPKALQGARLGVARQFFGAHLLVDAQIERQLGLLRELGAVLVDPVTIPTLGQFGDAEMEVLLYELKAGLAAYLSTRGDEVPVRTLADIIAFNERHRDREMALFDQDLFLQAEAKGPLTDPTYLQAREQCRRLARVEGVEAVLSSHRLDALVAPTAGLPWLIDPVAGDAPGGGCSSLPAVAGTPHLTVPAGYVRGLPVGLSFMGPAWSEARLLALGYAFEQAARCRRPPGFLSSAGRL